MAIRMTDAMTMLDTAPPNSGATIPLALLVAGVVFLLLACTTWPAVMNAPAAFALADIPLPLVLAAHRIIRDCNDEFARLFGYERDELAGQSFYRLYPALSGFVLTGAMWRMHLSGGLVYEDQRIMQKRDGTRFWARARGRSRHPEDPFAEAIYCFEPMLRPVLREHRQLSQRRLQIMALVAQGKTSAVIAREIGLSQRTVEAHRARTMKALGLRNTAELVSWFIEQRKG